MKTSKLIKQLEKLKDSYGDLEVAVNTTDFHTINFCPIKEVSLLDSEVYKLRYTNFKKSNKIYIGIS